MENYFYYKENKFSLCYSIRLIYNRIAVNLEPESFRRFISWYPFRKWNQLLWVSWKEIERKSILFTFNLTSRYAIAEKRLLKWYFKIVFV